MKTNIHFWTAGKNQKDLFSVYDTDSNPFRLGDKFWFREDDLVPRAINKLKEEGWNDMFIQTVREIHENYDSYSGRYKIVNIDSSVKSYQMI